MPSGGTRPGAGRRKGSRSHKSADAIAKAKSMGLLPHEFLLAVSQGCVIDGHTPTFDQRMTAAPQAAPYYAPKLATLDHKITGTITLEAMVMQAVEIRMARERPAIEHDDTKP